MKPAITLILGMLFLAACATTPQTQPTPSPAPQANLPNPASVYCQQQGYRLEIRTAPDGSQFGVCVFPDGSECGEWAYFRGECGPRGQNNAPTEATLAPAVETASDGCHIYRDERLGYSFHYPADAEIVRNDDPLHGITVVGPPVNGETRFMFSIAHPDDREEYRPPEGADLAQWLEQHNLLGDTRMGDTQIAGYSAVHLYHERSPQSYASDRYYFARAGQLFVINTQSFDAQEVSPYNHLLQTLQFEPSGAEVVVPTAIPSALPVDTAGYAGWWTYTHPEYNFSIQLPGDWVVENVTTGDPVMDSHAMILRPAHALDAERIRLAFRRPGEDVLLYPTGVGEGEFLQQSTLDVTGAPARRMLLMCQGGEITSIWYHEVGGPAYLTRGGIEFGFMFSAGASTCDGNSLSSETQLLGEMIIASLIVAQ
mgnify:CR=1 FL=1